MRYVILDPATQGAQLVGSTEGQVLTGRTVVQVADSFTWRYRKVDWATKTIMDDVAAFQADLIAKVKVIGERLSMLALTAGGAKKLKYSKKHAEVEAWYAMGPVTATIAGLVAALDPAIRKRKFRFAIRDAARRGDTIAAAIARFEAGETNSDDQLADFEAIEQAGVAAIKAAASTITAKQQAYDAIAWGVTPDVMTAAMAGTSF